MGDYSTFINSLQNIFKEIKNSYPDFEIPKHGCLKKWIKNEKILLLNSALTVIEGKSNSHANLWEKFTNKLIEFVFVFRNFILFIFYQKQK